MVSFPTIQFLQQCRYVHHVGAPALDVRHSAVLATVPQIEHRQSCDPAGIRDALEWCIGVCLQSFFHGQFSFLISTPLFFPTNIVAVLLLGIYLPSVSPSRAESSVEPCFLRKSRCFSVLPLPDSCQACMGTGHNQDTNSPVLPTLDHSSNQGI